MRGRTKKGTTTASRAAAGAAIAFLLLSVEAAASASTGGTGKHDGASSSASFSNEWVVSLRSDVDADELQLMALKLGYEVEGELRGFPNHYLLRKSDHPIENRDASSDHTFGLLQEARVLWAQQLFQKTRVKRRPKSNDELDSASLRELTRVKRRVDDEDIDFWRRVREVIREDQSQFSANWERSMSEGEGDVARGIDMELLAMWDEEAAKADGEGDRRRDRPDGGAFNDPLWDHQWYIQDTRAQSRGGSALPEINLHVLEAFRMGLSGKGVRVCVLDDGLEHQHDDLKDNYDPDISYDYNSCTAGDPDPTPRYPQVDPDDPDAPQVPNSHGTRCAGEIAMVANNGICGVGVAHSAKIGGIRMLDGKINDRIEGLSLSHSIDKVDVFTASWGPSDDGKTVEGPGKLAQRALEKGVAEGRGGKGVIYVWAAGNGGMHQDNCNCDGYTSSRFTISIGSASEQGEFPWYGERCATTMASTYSSGAYTDQKIASTDTNNSCTVSHTGTSAAAPLAAGIVALTLEANPSLTWRDVQHLTALTADPSPILEGSPGWEVNGAGLRYNSRFGFGVMDAARMAKAAGVWKTVDEQNQYNVTEPSLTTSKSGKFESGDVFRANFFVGPTSDTGIGSLEHVQVRATIEYPIRGALEIVLVSPSKTVSQLLTVRPEDDSDEGFEDWDFGSVHFWGEEPEGTWTLYVVDNVNKGEEDPLRGRVSDLGMTLWGTRERPQMFDRVARMFDKDDGRLP